MKKAHKPAGRTEVARLKRQLDALFLRCEALPEEEEITGDLNRYLCVRVSGFLEQALVVAGRSMCEGRAFGEGLRFAHSWLERAPNPRADEIVRLVNRFDAKWGEELERILSDEERYARVNALLGIRNDIAHGKNQGVSRRQVWEYYKLAEEIVDWILDRFEPQ